MMAVRMSENNQQGFLMIEVLIAIVIVSVALIAAVGMFIQSTTANVAAADYTAAANLAQKQLELLKQKPASYWNNLKAQGLPKSVDWQNVRLDGVSYNVATTAQTCPEDSANLIQVTVSVTWNRNGRSHEVSLTTFYPAPAST